MDLISKQTKQLKYVTRISAGGFFFCMALPTLLGSTTHLMCTFCLLRNKVHIIPCTTANFEMDI